MIRLVHVLTVSDSLLFLAGQIAFMKRRGYEVTVVSSPGEALDRFGEREGVAVYGIDMPRRVTPVRDLRSVRALARLLRRIRPDVVHAHTPKGGLLGMLSAAAIGVPARIYHMRGLPLMTATGPKRALLSTTERISCALAHQVVCVSKSLREFALDAKLVDPQKIQVLAGGSGNGVDCDGRFDPARLPVDTRKRVRATLGVPEGAITIGFVGRIVRDKGIEELWEAWCLLRDRFPRLHLIVLGPFETQDRISEACRSGLEGDSRVHLCPFTTDTPPFYASMDIVALPTYREGFPNVPLEAASMGIPVVATRIPGCVDAVQDGVTGTLVEVKSSTSLAAGLEAYVKDASLRRRHGDAGRVRVVRDFRPVRIWNELDALYRRTLDSRPSRRNVETRPHTSGE